MTLRTVALLALVLAPTASAAPQLTQLWNRRVVTPSGGILDAAVVRADSSGGCRTARIYRDAGTNDLTLIVNAYGPNSGSLWSVTVPLGPLQLTTIGAVAADIGAGDDWAVLARTGATYRVLRFDPDGTLTFDVTPALGPGELSLRSLVEPQVTPSGRVLVVESVSMSGPLADRGYLRSFAIDGTQEWRTEVVPPYLSSLALADAVDERGIVGIGEQHAASVQAIDASGTIEWTAVRPQLALATAGTYVRAVRQNTSREIAVLLSDESTTETIVAKYASDGTESFWTRLGFYVSPFVAGMQLASDGSIVYSQVGTDFPFQGPERVLLGQLDPLGAPAWTIPAPPLGSSIDLVGLDGNDGPICARAAGPPGGASVGLVTAELSGFNADGTPDWNTTVEAEFSSSSMRRVMGVSRAGRGFLFQQRRASGGNPDPGPAELARFEVAPRLGSLACPGADPNSTGQLGVLHAVGSDNVLEDRIVLVASDLPRFQTTIFLASLSIAPTPTPLGFGSGLLCLGIPVRRFGVVRFSDILGNAALELELDALPGTIGPVAAVAGETWSFQAWHRDVLTANLTSAVSVLLQ